MAFSVSNDYLSRNVPDDYSYEDYLYSPLPQAPVSPEIFIKRATEYSLSAKDIHDKIEVIYKEAMNFTEVDEVTKRVLDFFSD
jgi:hypothetical protein